MNLRSPAQMEGKVETLYGKGAKEADESGEAGEAGEARGEE